MTRIICFSGIDGSGKTTIINAVRQELAARGIKTFYFWLRYNFYLSKFLHAYCRLAGFTRRERHGEVLVAYHNFHESRAVSWLAVILRFIDTFGATVVLVYLPLLLTRRVILCDRWIIDILIDLSIATRKQFDEKTRWGRAYLCLVPPRAKLFLLLRSSCDVEDARPENRMDRNYARRRELFEQWSASSRIIAVNNNGRVEDAVGQVLAQLQPATSTF